MYLKTVCLSVRRRGLQAATNPWGGQQRSDSFATGTFKASTLLADADWLPPLFPFSQCAADLRHWFNHSCFAASHSTSTVHDPFSPLPLMLINTPQPLGPISLFHRYAGIRICAHRILQRMSEAQTVNISLGKAAKLLGWTKWITARRASENGCPHKQLRPCLHVHVGVYSFK